MNLEIWNKEAADWWANLHGTHEYPYGYYRLPLINPVIWHVATELNAGRENIGIYTAFANLKSAEDYKKTTLEKWHKEKTAQESLPGIKNIDLGCGEGYLGRWLTSMGAKCIGVDGSDKLIATSRERNKKNIVTLLQANLDKKEDLENLSQQLGNYIGDANEKILVTMIALLDHLYDPQALFDKLSTILRNKKMAWLLVVTLNHQFYEKTALPERQRVTIKHPSKNEHIEVPVWFRKKSDYETIFRNSGFHVVDFASPRQPNEYYDAEPKEASPFNIWLLRPGKRGEFKNISDALDKSRLLRNMQDLHDHLPTQLEFIEFEPEEQIIYPHNLGGDVYVVTAGDASLMIRGEPARSFQRGEILGDFETWSHHPSYYSFPVQAGIDGCVVARIPAEIWKSILDVSPNADRTGTILFKQLRDRFKTQLWLYQRRDTHGVSFKVGSLSIDARRLTNLARLLLVAISKEREDPGRVNEHTGSVIYLDLNSAVKLISDSGRNMDFAAEQRVLISLGIDAYIGRTLSQEMDKKERVKGIWDSLVDKILKKFFTPPDLNETQEKHFAAIRAAIKGEFTKLFEIDVQATGERRSTNSNSQEKKLGEAIDQLSKTILDNPILSGIDESTIKQCVNFMCKVNAHLLFNRVPFFFHISEDSELLLRRLALDDAIQNYIENKILFENKKLLGRKNPPSFDTLAKEAPLQRINTYLKAVEGFLHQDLEGIATLHFSVPRAE